MRKKIDWEKERWERKKNYFTELEIETFHQLNNLDTLRDLAYNRQRKFLLEEYGEKITNREKGFFEKKSDKIPTLPFLILGKIINCSWCFECLAWISEAGNHRVIKNRNDARFWEMKGELEEKKALCGNCLGKRIWKIDTMKRYLWIRYQKRGYWKKN